MSKELIEFNKIPITVLQGFLGSGKTTLLNYILTHNEGMNIGVVVNDFGDINIDSKLVKSKSDKRLELTSGCICCSLKTLDLQEAIDQFVYKDSNIDYIIIEASGLAEPRDLALTLRTSLGQKVRLDGIVTVVDAENLEKNASEHDFARDQILFCDFVIINKIDLVSKQKVADIHQMIEGFNPRVRILESVRGQIDIRLILDQDLYKSKKIEHVSEEHDDHDHFDHVHEKYSTYSWSSSEPLHPMKFQEFVNRKLPLNVYRAKGIVDFGLKGHMRKYIFQLVGVRPEIVWENWDEKPQTELVFIGQDIDEELLKKELDACIDTEPDKPLEGNIELKLPKKAEL
jgi:G3E family GTPase